MKKANPTLLVRWVNIVAKAAMLIALVVSAVFYLKRSAAKPVRDLCERYQPGSAFTVENFAKEVKAEGVVSASVSDEKEMFSLDGQTDLSKFSGKPFGGRASATALFGSQRFTCEIYVENARVIETGSRWWN